MKEMTIRGEVSKIMNKVFITSQIAPKMIVALSHMLEIFYFLLFGIS